MAMDEGGRFLGVHPAIKLDAYGRPMYDSSDEPEAQGRMYEQSHAFAGGAHFDAAEAEKTDLPCFFTPLGNGDDLLMAAPKVCDDTD